MSVTVRYACGCEGQMGRDLFHVHHDIMWANMDNVRLTPFQGPLRYYINDAELPFPEFEAAARAAGVL